jgi:hypothetical protein
MVCETKPSKVHPWSPSRGDRAQRFDAASLQSVSSLGLRMFAPPIGPSDLARCTSGLHDGPLFSGTECPTEACQRRLDKPRFESHSCSLAVRIEFLGHPQGLQCRCDVPGRYYYPDDVQEPPCAWLFSNRLNSCSITPSMSSPILWIRTISWHPVAGAKSPKMYGPPGVLSLAVQGFRLDPKELCTSAKWETVRP